MRLSKVLEARQRLRRALQRELQLGAMHALHVHGWRRLPRDVISHPLSFMAARAMPPLPTFAEGLRAVLQCHHPSPAVPILAQ